MGNTEHARDRMDVLNMVDEDGKPVTSADDEKKNKSADDTQDDPSKDVDPNVDGHPSGDDDTQDTSDDDGDDADDSDDTKDGGGDPDDLESVWNSSGLASKYATPQAALRAVAEQNKTITELTQTNAQMRGTLEKVVMDHASGRQDPPAARKRPEPMDADAWRELFDNDPAAALRKAGILTRADLERYMQPLASNVVQLRRLSQREQFASIFDRLEGLQDVAEHARKNEPQGDDVVALLPRGMNKRWDAIRDMYRTSNIDGDPAQVFNLLYRATAGVAGTNGNNSGGGGGGTPQVPKTSERQKRSVTGAPPGGAKRTVGSGKPLTEKEIKAMSEKELENYISKNNLWGALNDTAPDRG